MEKKRKRDDQGIKKKCNFCVSLATIGSIFRKFIFQSMVKLILQCTWFGKDNNAQTISLKKCLFCFFHSVLFYGLRLPCFSLARRTTNDSQLHNEVQIINCMCVCVCVAVLSLYYHCIITVLSHGNRPNVRHKAIYTTISWRIKDHTQKKLEISGAKR